MKIKILLLFIVICFQSCMFLDNNQNEGEAAFQMDQAPANYNPTFVTDTVSIDSIKVQQPEISISRIDQYSEDKTKLFVNLIGDKSYLLTGALGPNWKQIWCEVTDSTNGTLETVKYKIRDKKESEVAPIAMAIVMDHSGSMGNDRALSAQSAIDDIISKKRTKDMVAIVKYDNHLQIACPLTDDTLQLKAANEKIGLQNFGGTTAILDGINEGITALKQAPKGYRKVIVVFTDGYENSSKLRDSIVIAEAFKNEVLICAVDYGNNIDPKFMKNIAEKSKGIYQHIYLTNEFSNLFQDIYLRLNNFYVIEYEPTSYGDHHVRIKLCLPDSTIYTEMVYNNDPLPGTLNLLNVYFDVNKATIQKTSEPALNKLFRLMQKKPDVRIMLQGHTDSTGKAENNLKLSDQRAVSVKNELVKRGIDASRIEAKGYGDTMPIAPNSSEEGRQKNRRTEFIIIKN